MDLTPPSWLVAPTDLVLQPGEPLDCQLAGWDLSGLARWVVNDTDHFAISGDGRLTNVTSLALGSYGVAVDIYDVYDNMIRATFKVTVREGTTTGPILPIDLGILGFWVVLIGLPASFGVGLLLIRRRKSNIA